MSRVRAPGVPGGDDGVVDSPADQPPRPPHTGVTATDLVILVQHAVSAVHLDVPGPGAEVSSLGFGVQTDVQPVHPDTRTASSDIPNEDSAPPPSRTARRVAAYLAKYVTKSVAEFGL